MKYNINYISIFKKLLKYILISAIFKLIVFFLVAILSFFNINDLFFNLLIWILLFNNIIISKNKKEYIITIGFLMGFWYVVGNIFSINESASFLSIFILFASNYDALLSFDLSNDYYSKFLNSNEWDFEFKFLNSIITAQAGSTNFWLKDIKLIETNEYDPIGSVQKLNVETFSTHLVLENSSYKTFESNIEKEEVFDNKDQKLKRLDLIKKMRLQGELFNIKSINLSIGYQLDTIIDNLIKYEAEMLKFNNIIMNIENGTELFYDPKAKSLFLEYLNLLPYLLEDLRSKEFNILCNLPPLPDQTEAEIDSLSPQSVPLPEQSEEEIESLSPQSVPLPEQSEEEVNSLLEVEDIMEDAIKNMGMFSEND